MTWFDWLLIATIVGLVLCPTKWDPTIRFCEWLNDREDRRNAK